MLENSKRIGQQGQKGQAAGNLLFHNNLMRNEGNVNLLPLAHLICIMILFTTIFGCDRVNNYSHTVLPDGSTQTVAVSCHTLLGIPVLCWVVHDTVRHVEVETIIEKIVEGVVVEEKRIDVPVEKLIERVVYITEIGETQEIQDIVEYTVSAIGAYIPPEGFKEVPISDVAAEVVKIIESTPPAIQRPVQQESPNVDPPIVVRQPPNVDPPTVVRQPPNVGQPAVQGNWCFVPNDPADPNVGSNVHDVDYAREVLKDTKGCIYATLCEAVKAQDKFHGTTPAPDPKVCPP